jgi:phenylacetate-CoA ligase
LKALKAIYDNSPYWFQHVMLNYYALKIHRERYGKTFRDVFDRLKQTQWYSSDEIHDFQTTRLKKLISHAYLTVPFYRDLYAKHGFSPDKIKELQDVSLVPVITRDDIRHAGHELISEKFSLRHLIHGHTSGTTGSPISFYWDKQTCVYTNAVDWRQKHWADVHYGDKIAVLLGRTIVKTDRTSPPFWQHDRIHNMLWMSSFHLSEKYLPQYIKKLRQYEPVAVEGYPSTMYILALYLKSIGKKLPVKSVFTSSETLLPMQRSLIESQFDAPVFDFYGLAERVAFATQCPEEHEYHLNFEYAFNEVVDMNGRRVENGSTGYLVGTSLHNYGMPFIRYKTTDITSIQTGQCLCGRHMPRFKSITTKDEDIVVTPEGKLVSSSVLTHPIKSLKFVRESQIVQDKINVLTVKIVPQEGSEERDVNQLIHDLRERVGPSIRIEVKFVHSIPRTEAGKFRWVISKVPLPL